MLVEIGIVRSGLPGGAAVGEVGHLEGVALAGGCSWCSRGEGGGADGEESRGVHLGDGVLVVWNDW